jgi:hypothetical protein
VISTIYGIDAQRIPWIELALQRRLELQGDSVVVCLHALSMSGRIDEDGLKPTEMIRANGRLGIDCIWRNDFPCSTFLQFIGHNVNYSAHLVNENIYALSFKPTNT